MSILGSIVGWKQGTAAANNIYDANVAAEHGVLGQASDAANNVRTAQQVGVGAVRKSIGEANDTIAGGYNSQRAELDPYLAAGKQGVQGLADYAATNPKFSYTRDNFADSDAYKFQQQQGNQAIANQATLHGLASSGNVGQEFSRFNQGLASTYYQQSFDNALKTFQTNQDATLANLGTLAGIGQTAVGQNNQVTQNATGQMAANTLGGGYFEGNTGIGIEQFLAQHGQNAATLAGNFGIGAGNAMAAKNLNTGNQVTSLLEGAGQFLGTGLSGGGWNPATLGGH